ncbi:MAG: hypothetical protein LUC44_07300 [Prevotellaceae bacterium]|nr:hypothetical protein [Prevotellaceae bacterium]
MKKKVLTAKALLPVIGMSLLLCVVCWSCGKGNGKAQKPLFTAEDTTIVLQLTQEYLNHVHDGEYDAAIAMLHDIMNDSVRDLTQEREESIREQQRMFPVVNYRLDEMEFVDEHRVQVSYVIEFFEKEPGSSIPNTIKLRFVPQRIKDQWYLELSEIATSRRTKLIERH